MTKIDTKEIRKMIDDEFYIQYACMDDILKNLCNAYDAAQKDKEMLKEVVLEAETICNKVHERISTLEALLRDVMNNSVLNEPTQTYFYNFTPLHFTLIEKELGEG